MHGLRPWRGQQPVSLQWMQPGKPTQNVFVEHFQRSFRTEVLNAELFGALADARQRCAAWQDDYNTLRPHQALNFLTPTEYLTARTL